MFINLLLHGSFHFLPHWTDASICLVNKRSNLQRGTKLMKKIYVRA